MAWSAFEPKAMKISTSGTIPRRLSQALIPTLLLTGTCLAQGSVTSTEDSRHGPPPRWWESAAAAHRVTLKSGTHFPQLSLDSRKAAAELDRVKSEAISVLEIFAPAHGGRSYAGLDANDRYRIDPELGTMDDFHRLVRRGLAKRPQTFMLCAKRLDWSVYA